MQKTKKLWRTILFLILIAALCGSFGFPAADTKVRAAPRLQATTEKIVISEFRTRGPSPSGGTNEFIEIYNPTSRTVNLEGWSIRYSTASGNTSNRYNFPTGSQLQPGQYFLLANSDGYSGTTAPDATYTSGLGNDGGIAILDPSSNVVDQVGMSTGSTYKEPADGSGVLSPLTVDAEQSYERKFGGNNGNCTDTNNNASDFILNSSTSNPQNLVSTRIPCIAVIDVTSPVDNDSYTAPEAIDIIIKFNGNIDVTGTPTLLLETGATDRAATYVSGSGSDTLAFSYSIMPGDSSSDLDYVSTSSLELNGGTIKGATGDAVLLLPAPGSAGSLGANKNIVIDNGTAPTVTVNQAAGQADPTSTLPITFDVVFSEPIDANSFTASDIVQTGTATGITWTVTDAGNHTNFTLRATVVTGGGTVIPSIPANAATDPGGNGNTASTSPTDPSVTYTPTTPQGIVISEFRTTGPAGANDEFIELYNPTAAPVDISAWKINASNDSGTIETRVTIPAFTILRSGQYYLIANNSSNGGYSKTSVAPDLTYGTGITNAGGIALLRIDNTIVDRVGVGTGSAYKEGTPLASLSGTSDQSYERKLGGDSDSCQDTNDNSNDFNRITPSDPKNYSSGLSLCGVHQPNVASTSISITGHSPNPSVVNAGVSVSVSVTVPFGSSIPTGVVSITGANTNCNITLTAASAGRGSCTVVFSSTGSKTLTATYLGDNLHLKSSTTTAHQVNTSSVVVPTSVATPRPPPELVAINEFVPRPGHDWNNDGVVNVGDEYIELLNHGTVNVNLNGYSLDDEVNIGSSPFRLPSVTIRPGERIVFYGSQTALLLSDGGDGVRLLKPNGQLADAFNYSVVGYPDQSYCRLPDNGGADDWNNNCFPTPGLQNSLSGVSPIPVNNAGEQLYCPIADTLPDDFTLAECEPFGSNIWRPEYWDQTGWYGEKYLPGINGKWPVFAN